MQSYWKYLLFITLSVSTVQCKVVSQTTGDWTHQVDLSEDYGIKFRWRNSIPDDNGERWLFMEFSAKASGYVGVGFSPHGGMAGGDMAIAWRNSDGSAQLMDFYGIENGPPIKDDKQDYTLLKFAMKEGWTTFSFKRRWDTCDDSDIAITNDTMRLIWAYSDENPKTFDKKMFTGKYHDFYKRGARSVILADGGAYPPFPDEKPELYSNEVKSWDFKVNHARVEPINTTYYCQITKFTDTDKKHHMIGWRPIIQKENKNIVHHIVMFECNVPAQYVSLFDHHDANSTGGSCYTPNMPPEWARHCVGFAVSWVVGSEGEMFPEHVGTPLGEEHGGATYFMFEMHYENPGFQSTTDSSGIRIFYTQKLRKYDGAVMLVGYRHSPFLLIPPRQDDFMIHGLCTSECTSRMIPPTGIHITNTLVHMHLTGKRIRLRHFRNGVELPLLAEDNHYDFNYQQSRTLQNELTVLPGDELVTECEYNTSFVDRYVLGGLATDQEMCQVFFTYYPRVPLTQCTSQYEFHDFFEGVGIHGVKGPVLKALNMPYEPSLLTPEQREIDLADDARELEAIEEGISYKSVFDFMNVTSPHKLAGKTAGKILEGIHWTGDRGLQLESFWKNGKHYQFCSKPALKRVVLDKHIVNYPKLTQPLKKELSNSCRLDLRSDASKASFISTNMFCNFFMLAILPIIHALHNF